jgi:hypothetical protein
MNQAAARPQRADAPQFAGISQSHTIRAAAPPIARPVRRRPVRSRPVSDRVVASGPDRLAMWAVVLGLFMVGLAVTTAQAGSGDSPDKAPPPQKIELTPKPK